MNRSLPAQVLVSAEFPTFGLVSRLAFSRVADGTIFEKPKNCVSAKLVSNVWRVYNNAVRWSYWTKVQYGSGAGQSIDHCISFLFSLV
jgi:hypothetical protein